MEASQSPLAIPLADIVHSARAATKIRGDRILASPGGSGLQSLSGRVATSGAADADLTVDGEVLGTPAYMPPEQATGQIQAIDQRSDIYALGAILYAMLALRPPVGRENHYTAVLLRVAEGQIRPPEEDNARRVRAGQIPRELSAVAMKALAKRPEDRYQTVEALPRDIELFQKGRSVSAKADTKWEQFSKLVKRNKGLSLGVAVAALVLLCSLGVVGKAWWETNRADAAYQKEQEDKAERTRKAVPAFVKVARLAVNQLEFDEALSDVSLALDYAPDQADARLLKGQLLIVKKDYAGARRELETYLAKRPQAAGADPPGLGGRRRVLCLPLPPCFPAFPVHPGDIAMSRRDMLRASGAAVLGLSAFSLRWTAAADKKPQKVLYFTRSAGFVHSVVNRKDGELAHSEKVLTVLGKKAGFEVVCSQEESVFDGDLEQYDLIAFYTTGKVLSDQRKEKLLKTIHAGKGFVGFHCAIDTFHAKGLDPYRAMVGAEFTGHGAQQKATMKIVSPDFPGIKGLGDSFALNEEWYTFHKFLSDLHVILGQVTQGMTGPLYQRPPYPATWARLHGKGRVFYTSMGHREDVWTNPIFQQIALGGIAWALRNVDAEVPPNIAVVTPRADEKASELKKAARTKT